MPLSAAKKAKYQKTMESLLDSHTRILVVSADNVGSRQMQQIRVALRGSATILMGKNTLMRFVLTEYLRKNPGHPARGLLRYLVGNVGLVFTNKDLVEVRDTIVENKVPAAARAGAISPVDVVVPPGMTGCDPGQTSFFQALQISTKIKGGQIEIISPVFLLEKGQKVGSSEAALLQKLDIRPFSYALQPVVVYDDGTIFSPAVLDLSEDDLAAKFAAAASWLAAVSLEIGFPTMASLPHSITRGFRNLLAVAAETEFSFPEAESVLAYLKDPSAFAVAAPAGGDAGAAAAAEPEEEEEEEEVEMGGLFGDDSDDDW